MEETKELKITAPEGYEIDKEHSSFEHIVFKPIEKKLPKTWEEFCETHPIQEGEVYIGTCSQIISRFGNNDKRDSYFDRNIFQNYETAEAFVVLMQLIQLRDAYNGDWKPDWNSIEDKYVIYNVNNEIFTTTYKAISKILTFKTKELRDEFLKNFRGLIEVAKPLI